MKVRSNELRISNLLWKGSNTDRIHHRVTPFTMVDLFREEMQDEEDHIVVWPPRLGYEMFGINISHDILIKSGFEFQKEDGGAGSPDVYTLFENLRFFHLKPIGDKVTKYGFVENDSWETPYKPIQFVHQLQNLYFALYGEELNIVL